MGNNRSFKYHFLSCIILFCIAITLIFTLDFNREKPIKKGNAQTVDQSNVAMQIDETIQDTHKANYVYCGEYKISSYTHIDELTCLDDYVLQGIASSKDFSIGTKVYIEGIGIFTITDNYCEENNTIEVLLNTKNLCKEFGTKIADVYMIKD